MKFLSLAGDLQRIGQNDQPRQHGSLISGPQAKPTGGENVMGRVRENCRLIKFAALSALILGLFATSPSYAVTQDVIWDLGCATQPACQNLTYASPHTFTSLAPAP